MSGRTLGAKAAAARESIAELCENPPSALELIDEVAERVKRIIPYDTGAWMTADPDSALPTGISKSGGSPALHKAFSEAELLGDGPDINGFDDMIRSGRTAVGLALITGGNLRLSRRYREVHEPFGLHDELRLVGRSANATWALGCVSRGDDLPDFSEDEVRWAAAIADHLGAGVRTALGRPREGGELLSGPGMIVLSADGEIEATTGEADRWLDTLGRPPGWLPAPILSVAMQAQANSLGRGVDRPARLRVQVPGGGWLLVHADVLRQAGEAAAKVAVMMERADRAALATLLIALHGLTGREREVAELLVSGLSTDEIATRMHISRHTLRDHTKSIFAKVGVTSRPELTAALGQEPLAA